ncbi:hypothetical protein PRIPAC_86226 [Pristionchus pacificus]|uniref:Uncharacterized protein n=1 Tax=Pristionchus pacificus TaxID=54126 RepID=A0A2A6BLC6_PRIPA|nr:hypothetical protein PRIPAC_86226 [Pristionchus pacificus]|eukprot:PDM66616.1 hypothetical protein PRIPAC_48033 [Pristionchus pacificus]
MFFIKEKVKSIVAAELTNGVAGLQIKLERLTTESEFRKSEIDRYKKELAETTTKSKTVSNDLHKSLKTDRAKIRQLEIDLANAQAQSAVYQTKLNSKIATESKDMVSFRAKVNRQLEVDLANAQAQSAVYQVLFLPYSTFIFLLSHKAELNSKIATELYGMSSIQSKIGNVEKMLKKKGDDNSGLRGLIIASDAEQKKMVEKLEKMNLDLNCHFNEANKSLLRARFTEISKLTETYTYSSSVKLAGMDWAIFVCTEMIGDKKYLSAYIEILSKPIPES